MMPLTFERECGPCLAWGAAQPLLRDPAICLGLQLLRGPSTFKLVAHIHLPVCPCRQLAAIDQRVDTAQVHVCISYNSLADPSWQWCRRVSSLCQVADEDSVIGASLNMLRALCRSCRVLQEQLDGGARACREADGAAGTLSGTCCMPSRLRLLASAGMCSCNPQNTCD